MASREVFSRTYCFSEGEREQYHAYRQTGHSKTAERYAQRVDRVREFQIARGDLRQASGMDPNERLRAARNYVEYEPRDLVGQDELAAAERDVAARARLRRARNYIEHEPRDGAGCDEMTRAYDQLAAAETAVAESDRYYSESDASNRRNLERDRVAADQAHRDWERSHRTAARTEQAVSLAKRGARGAAVALAGALGGMGGAAGGGALGALAGGVGAPLGGMAGGYAGGEAASGLADRTLPRPRPVHRIYQNGCPTEPETKF